MSNGGESRDWILPEWARADVQVVRRTQDLRGGGLGWAVPNSAARDSGLLRVSALRLPVEGVPTPPEVAPATVRSNRHTAWCTAGRMCHGGVARPSLWGGHRRMGDLLVFRRASRSWRSASDNAALDRSLSDGASLQCPDRSARLPGGPPVRDATRPQCGPSRDVWLTNVVLHQYSSSTPKAASSSRSGSRACGLRSGSLRSAHRVAQGLNGSIYVSDGTRTPA